MKVCILGDSLTSLTLAKALVNLNICVDIFSEKKSLTHIQTRTLGISKSNVDFFKKNIINFEKLLWKLKKIEIFTDNLKEEKLLNFENNDDQIFSIIKNCDLYQLLEKDLSKNKFFKKKKSINKKLSFTNDYELIINCDYFHPLTKKYFNKKIFKKYNSFAYTTLIQHEKVLNNVATQIFTKKGPLAFLPISDNETSIVYSVHNLNGKNNENIKNLIQKYNFKYKIKKIHKVDRFELKSYNLRSYYNNNILAFGDLLHRVHPLAGQGFNMTIRDIKIFIDIIKSKLKLGLPIDSSVNEEFENNLKHKNFIFTEGVDLIYNLFNVERKIKNNIISKSIQLIGKNYPVNKMFMKIADKGFLF
ncbi:FAD-dependent monooxygenase [Pelagibacterales bacterium SAG-MED46]|nr:FAD-dependent monooxygenase [Pelagibacterales bacterium SAG-MED46]